MELDDIWGEEVPQYLSVESTKSCRLVCKRWAHSFQLPNVIIVFPLLHEDQVTSGRVFELSADLILGNVSQKSEKQFETVVNCWKQYADSSKVISLSVEGSKFTNASSTKFVHLIQHYSKIQTFVLDDSVVLSPSYQQKVLEALALHGHLRKLYLASNFGHLASVLPKLSHLEYFSLLDAQDDDKGLKELISALPACSHLKFVSFLDVELNGDHISSLAHFLMGPCCIESLDINPAPSSTAEMIQLVDALRTNSSLTALQIWSTMFINQEFMSHFAVAIEANKTLRSLTWGMDHPMLSLVFTALKSNTSVKTLQMYIEVSSSEQMEPHALDLELAAEALAVNKSLTSLEIDGGVSHGLSSLCDVLASKNTTLRRLHLWNHSPEMGYDASNLAGLLKSSSTLQYLTIKCQQGGSIIGDEGVAEMINALIQNSKSGINYLDLSLSGFSTAGCHAIAKFLESPHCQLQYLAVRENPLQESAVNLMFKALETNKTLQSLDIEDCEIDIPSLEVLVDVLKQNSTLIGLGIGGDAEDEYRNDALELVRRICSTRPRNVGLELL